MKKWMICIAVLVVSGAVCAQPTRVALLDFEDDTGMGSDRKLGGMITPASLAQKGVYFLSKDLLGDTAFSLIDRRDFISQIEQLQYRDGAELDEKHMLRDRGRDTPTKPSFLQAAQALRADVVLRGSLVSFSTGKQMVNQGGYRADFSTLTVRVIIEALDAVNGAVIAMADGSASRKFRQTEALSTVLSEDDVLHLLDEAIRKAVPDLQQALAARVEQQRERPKVKLFVSTDADPALVEIDGILVGSTPIEGLEVYKGDHVLAVGKPGFQDVTKRIMLEQDTRITVPMLSTQLNAEQLQQVLEKMRLNVYSGIEPALVVETISE
jgi:hypothetical protein